VGEDTHIYIYKGRERGGIERERVYIMRKKLRERVSEREACVCEREKQDREIDVCRGKICVCVCLCVCVCGVCV